MAVLNGLDLDQVQELIQQVQQNPGSAQPLNTWNARVRWLGGFKAKAFTRSHAFVIVDPLSAVRHDTAEMSQDNAGSRPKLTVGDMTGFLTREPHPGGVPGFLYNADSPGWTVIMIGPRTGGRPASTHNPLEFPL